jgi:hypothetical protein
MSQQAGRRSLPQAGDLEAVLHESHASHRDRHVGWFGGVAQAGVER